MTAWEEAVKAVEHGPGCLANPTEWRDEYRPCTCDRDARIAKGIEAVRNEALSEYGFCDEYGDPNVPVAIRCTEYNARTLAEHLAAFTEASR